MFKIVSITRQQKVYFMGMDLLMLMDRMDLDGISALGAIIEDEETHEPEPAGLMVYSEGKQGYTIHWLFVDALYRFRGIGSELLAAVFRASNRKGYPVVNAYLPFLPERELFCAHEERYLKEHLFRRKKTLPGEWHSDVKTVNAVFESLKLPDSRVTPLSGLPDGERKNILKTLKSVSAIDPELSIVLHKEGRSKGVLLVETTEVTDPIFQDDEIIPCNRRVLYPMQLDCGSELEAVQLAAEACRVAARKYPGDTEICVISRKPSMSGFYNRLMPEGHVDSLQMMAEVADYAKLDVRGTEGYIL